MYVLGINESHTSTAALLKDGQIIACASEERFTRVKGQGGFPKHAIRYCLEYANISIDDLDLIVSGFERDPSTAYMYQSGDKRYAVGIFFWKIKKIAEFLTVTIGNFFPPSLFIYDFLSAKFHKLLKPLYRRRHLNLLSKKLGVSEDRVTLLEHHLAHGWASYSVFESDDKRLIITNDGMGEGACGRVFEVKGDKWQEIAQTPDKYSLGYFYYYVTEYLGFTPNEEEHKVMGLAPYVERRDIEGIYKDFKIFFQCRDLSFKSRVPRIGYYNYIKNTFEKKRFDAIAGAMQRLTEELICEQVKNTIKKTGIRLVVLGGGVAQNIKANMKISQLTQLEKLYVCPSSGDESTAIGSCFWGYLKKCQMSNVKCQIKPVNNLYLGPGFDKQQIDDVTYELKNNNKYSVQEVKNKDIAKLLSQGKIIARFAGRMEFGARALGNRSILADPRDVKVVRILNDQIKERDFWMPFAPTILAERVHDYLINPKNIDSPFMMIGFETTKLAQDKIPAALHPYDYTCRPQILKRDDNPKYYDIIKEFENITGVGAILNTSFNLHGEPIVCTPQDAIKTFKNSGLEYLLLEDYLIRKKRV